MEINSLYPTIWGSTGGGGGAVIRGFHRFTGRVRDVMKKKATHLLHSTKDQVERLL